MADNASIFNGWTGCDVTIGNQCTVNMTATRSITAEFNGVCKRTKKDFDGDGKSGILWQSKDVGDVYTWLMDSVKIQGSSGFVAKGIPSQWQIRSIADYDGDGKSDVHLQDVDTGKIYVWLMDGTTINSRGYADHGVPSDWGIY
ncbi:MAG: hypothetical protein HQL05_11005 [Nitrospirae bacterium]|nr:hypothetical protein [Nitrospirota bacterium]